MRIWHVTYFSLISTLVLGWSNPVLAAKSPQQVAQEAIPITVQVNDQRGGGGSGVIIAQRGRTYMVLTANHVVRGKQTYTIRTHDGKNYSITGIQSLQTRPEAPDLALVTFESNTSYPTAPLGNSDQASIGSTVYVIGFPAIGGKAGAERSLEFVLGYVTSRPLDRPEGYNLRYNVITKGGMSGGPVLNQEGNLVGIHGQGDLDESPITETGEKLIGIKTGFNAGMPINLFVSLINQSSEGKVLLDSLTTKTTQSLVSVNLTNPATPESFFVRGLSQDDQGKTQNAINDYTQALQQDPDNAQAFFYRAIAHLKEGRFAEAKQDFDQSLKQDPNQTAAYLNRGFVLHKLGDFQDAIIDFNKVTNQDPTEVKAYFLRAGSCREVGNTQCMKQDHKQVLELLIPEVASDYVKRCGSYYYLDQFQDAIAECTQALNSSPSSDDQLDAFYSRGVAQQALGNYSKAIEDYTQALTINPNYLDAYLTRGVAYRGVGDLQKALQDLQIALEMAQERGDEKVVRLAQEQIQELR